MSHSRAEGEEGEGEGEAEASLSVSVYEEGGFLGRVSLRCRGGAILFGSVCCWLVMLADAEKVGGCRTGALKTLEN